uniref:RING-type domain-containing protein n=1 Tax=Terrapene triunguis TaxID=2587831 RepID=A0A674JA41_9SAUR
MGLLLIYTNQVSGVQTSQLGWVVQSFVQSFSFKHSSSRVLVQVLDPGTPRTPCLPCSQRAGELYCFCWGCHVDWKDPSPQDESCSNPQCLLYNAPEIQAPGSSVHGCPLLRACPECHTLVSHTELGFLLVACLEYCMTFCYRCLKTAMAHCVQHSDPVHGGYGSPRCPVSPRQDP